VLIACVAQFPNSKETFNPPCRTLSLSNKYPRKRTKKSLILSYTFSDDLIHVLIVLLAFIVLAISLFAYLRRKETKYLLLLIAFLFLTLSQVVTFVETFYLANALILIPILDLHLTHLFDFLMLVSFGLALTR
jgi:heme A synthase